MSLFSCCFPISHEAQLLKSCYPPLKQLPATSAPLSADDGSYTPLGQELSRLTYYASNRPGKINRLAEELEERVGREGRKARAGYGKYRIYLLISLSIARALVTECRSDLSLFARSIIRIIDAGLDAAIAPYLPGASASSSPTTPNSGLAARNIDLEVALRCGALFAAFETYAEPAVLGADAVGQAYMSVLRKLARVAGANGVSGHGRANANRNGNGVVASEKEQEKDDDETRNRTRLVALAALSSAVQSETTFSTGAEFEQIIRIIVPALLENIWLGSLHDVQLETAKAEIDASPSPFFLEFSTRPPLRERRAPSLHAHVPGEKGPFTSDVVGAALRTLRRLLGQSHVSQISTIVLAMVAWLDADGGRRWADADKCRWLGEVATAFTMLQYRYAVPSTMLEVLAADADVQAPSIKHITLLSMLVGVLSQGKSSIVGLSTTEILGVIVHLVTRRCRISPDDVLLPQLVAVVDALSSHVYYADQANDLVEDLAGRIARVQAAGPTSATAAQGDQFERVTRQATLRVLVSCLASLIAAPQPHAPAQGSGDLAADSVELHAEVLPSRNTPSTSVGPSKRNAVSPEVWQETLPLLCEATFALRAEYAKTLCLYLEQELPSFIRNEISDDVEGIPMFEDSSKEGVQRFMHALFATLYTLAVSSNLGYAGPALAVPSPTDEERDETTDLADPTRPSFRLRQATGDSPQVESPAESSTSLARKVSNTPSNQTPRLGGRRMSKLVSLPLNRLDDIAQPEAVAAMAAPTEDAAGGSDYAIFCDIFERAAKAAPDFATLDGFPMLVALNRDAPTLLRRSGRTADSTIRITACREAAKLCLSSLLSAWRIQPSPELSARLQGQGDVLPSYQLSSAGRGLQSPERSVAFANANFTSHASAIDPTAAIESFASSSALARAANLSQSGVASRLRVPWSTTTALQNSIEQYETRKRDPRENFAMEEADRLRTISTQSSRSALQTAPRPVDVSDLRDALGGGHPSIAPKSAAPTVCTVQTRNRTDTSENAQPNSAVVLKSFTQGDVNDILKDIVRDKTRHKKSSNGSAATTVHA